MVEKFSEDQPRDEAGRWSNGVGAGADSIGGEGNVGGDSDLDRAVLDIINDRIFTAEERALPESTSQPFHSKEEAYAMAPEAQRIFQESLDNGTGVDAAIGAVAITAQNDHWTDDLPEVGIAVVMAPLKTEESASRKVADNFDGDWSRLSDVVRASIVVDRYEQIPSVMQAMRTEMSKRGVTFAERPDNRIARPTFGYEDIALKMRLPNGVTAEVLIIAKPVAIIKQVGEGHRIYERVRDIRAKVGKTDADYRELAQLRTASEAVYKPATDAAKGRG